MNGNSSTDGTRRTVLKGAAATGLAAVGVGAFGGGAVARRNVRNLNLNLSESDGLLTVNVQNVDVLRNLDVEDVQVTVIGGDALSNIDVEISDVDVDVNIQEVAQNILNDSVVQVAVAVLDGGGDIVAAGSDTLDF